jgi:hypothetical protein
MIFLFSQSSTDLGKYCVKTGPTHPIKKRSCSSYTLLHSIPMQSAKKELLKCHSSEANTGPKTTEVSNGQPSASTVTEVMDDLTKFMIPHIEMAKQVKSVVVEAETKLLLKSLPYPPQLPLLILDIDETLICRDVDKIIARPYIDYLFDVLYGVYEIWLWTASEEKYADFVADFLGIKSKVKNILGRSHCIKAGDIYVKNIRIFNNLDEKRVVIVDNLIVSFISELSNGVVIGTYTGNPDDKELHELANFLLDISSEEDLRIKIRESFDYTSYLKYN